MVHSIKMILGFSTDHDLQWLGLSTDLKWLVFLPCYVMVHSIKTILGFSTDHDLQWLSTDLKWLVSLYCHGTQYQKDFRV